MAKGPGLLSAEMKVSPDQLQGRPHNSANTQESTDSHTLDRQTVRSELCLNKAAF